VPAIGPIQLVVGILFLVGALGVIGVLIVVALHAHGPALTYAEVTKPAYRLRRFWLWIVLVAATGAFAASFLGLPYPQTAGARPALAVRVIGHQYYWQVSWLVSRTHFHVGQTVDFAVTSADVNHGFGIYDPHGVLVAQVQAMPDYINHLRFTFTTPGTYIARCLEYCGSAHYLMEIQFTVAKA
jgi:cytochrome c oxidase subunit 2